MLLEKIFFLIVIIYFLVGIYLRFSFISKLDKEEKLPFWRKYTSFGAAWNFSPLYTDKHKNNPELYNFIKRRRIYNLIFFLIGILLVLYYFLYIRK